MRQLPLAALSLIFALPVMLTAQTPAAAGTPVTSQTQVTPNGANATSPVAGTASTPMTKDELKAQRKQQKSQEKAAKDNAKAAKAQEKSLKAQNKATDAAQEAQPHP